MTAAIVAALAFTLEAVNNVDIYESIIIKGNIKESSRNIINQVSGLKNITYYGIKAVRESTFSINKNISVFVCSKYRGRTFGNITNITRSGSCIMKNYLCTHCKRSNTSHSFTNLILLLIYYHKSDVYYYLFHYPDFVLVVLDIHSTNK